MEQVGKLRSYLTEYDAHCRRAIFGSFRPLSLTQFVALAFKCGGARCDIK